MESIGNPMLFASGEPWSRDEGLFAPGENALNASLTNDRYAGFGSGLYNNTGSANFGSGMPPGAQNDPGDMLSGIRNAMYGLFAQLSGLMSRFGGQSCGEGGNEAPGCGGQSGWNGGGTQRYFTNATLSSTGDPHDALNGTLGTGQTEQRCWNSMNSHGSLISSDSIPGGFNVSTHVTPPDANGVTYNAQARITTNNGATSVSMERNGSYQIFDDGQLLTPASGVATPLGNGQSVTLNGNGSLTFQAASPQGGLITTTLTANGNGVDVSANANQVRLGGYLADEGASTASV